jgi:hypothetical protein
MKFITISLLFVSLLLASVGCKKNPEAVSPAKSPVLSVQLTQAYLRGTQVDSAFVNWKTGSTQQRFKMEQRNDSLVVPMNAFIEGNGELTIHIFANKKYSNQYLGQWLLRKTVRLEKTKTTSYTGPASFFDTDWFPRVELKDAIGHEATIALRPDDAYFIVKDPGHPIQQLTVERSYWKTVGGIQLAGREIWQCSSNCTGIANEEHFKTLPQRIGTKPWNHISIVVFFQVDDNSGWIIDLEHEP